jgi:hypothetical protein
MRRLPPLTRFACLVLAWFMASLAVAIAAPAVRPQTSQLVCGGSHMKVVVQDEGQALPASASLDCPLCAPCGAPPPIPVAGVPALPAAHAAPGVAVAPVLAVRVLAPPARGPPAGPALA